MGCCEGRDRNEGKKFGEEETLPVLLARESFGLLPSEDQPGCAFVTDPRFADIEAYALELLDAQQDWKVDFEDSTCSVRHLESSKFSSEQQVICCQARFTPSVPHGLLVDVLEAESVRKKWDLRLTELTVRPQADGSRVVTSTFSRLMITRITTEKRVNKETPDELHVIYYSPGPNDSSDSSNAFTLFGFNRFVTKEDTTEVTLLSQTDYRLPSLLKRALSSVNVEIGKWLQTYQKEVASRTAVAQPKASS